MKDCSLAWGTTYSLEESMELSIHHSVFAMQLHAGFSDMLKSARKMERLHKLVKALGGENEKFVQNEGRRFNKWLLML